MEKYSLSSKKRKISSISNKKLSNLSKTVDEKTYRRGPERRRGESRKEYEERKGYWQKKQYREVDETRRRGETTKEYRERVDRRKAHNSQAARRNSTGREDRQGWPKPRPRASQALDTGDTGGGEMGVNRSGASRTGAKVKLAGDSRTDTKVVGAGGDDTKRGNRKTPRQSRGLNKRSGRVGGL